MSKNSDEERILLLEEEVKYLLEYTQEIHKTQALILNGLSKIVDKDTNNTELLNNWTSSVDEKIKSLTVNLANLGFTFNTLYPLTEEQKIKLNKEKENIKINTKQTRE